MNTYVEGTSNRIVFDHNMRIVQTITGKTIIGAMSHQGLALLTDDVAKGNFPSEVYNVSRLVDGTVYLIEEY